jgi:hypothetical protein
MVSYYGAVRRPPAPGTGPGMDGDPGLGGLLAIITTGRETLHSQMDDPAEVLRILEVALLRLLVRIIDPLPVPEERRRGFESKVPQDRPLEINHICAAPVVACAYETCLDTLDGIRLPQGHMGILYPAEALDQLLVDRIRRTPAHRADEHDRVTLEEGLRDLPELIVGVVDGCPAPVLAGGTTLPVGQECLGDTTPVAVMSRYVPLATVDAELVCMDDRRGV